MPVSSDLLSDVEFREDAVLRARRAGQVGQGEEAEASLTKIQFETSKK